MMHFRKAFTLIEAMVVVCLCAFIASLAILNLSFLDTIIVRMELNKLMTACLYMQQLAIATNEEKHLIFDLHKHEYCFTHHREALSKRVRFGILTGVKGPPGSPHGAVEKAITFPHNRICFYPTGIISSGTVYLIDTNKKIVYALSNAVSQLSYMRMYRYNGSWKLCDDKK